MVVRITIVLALLVAILVAPFLLRPDDASVTSPKAERLIIISPHNESIRSEFERAFVRHMRQEFGREVWIDWRQPGGTSEIARYLKSEYANAFANLWSRKTGKAADSVILNAFANDKIDPETATASDELSAEAIEARRMFLESDLSSGIDLFFGGGAYDFSKQAGAGALVAMDASGEFGPAALAEEHPDWFSEEVMPTSASGEPFRDSEWRWVGTVLSAFGIVYNRDSLERLGIEKTPDSWADLTEPRYFGQVALADPTKSGSVTKAIEMIFQQQMRAALDSGMPEDEAIRSGWNRAMQMMLKISANSRYFTDQASKIPHDVAQGDATAGLCIDFYGRTFNELHRDEDGDSRVQFVMPVGGTSIGADPIGLLRGAPNPELAHRFLEFVLSPKGQKIWNYRVGEPGGPTRIALRRPPIRKDFYSAENRPHMSDPDSNPYVIAKDFTYEDSWTGATFGALRFIIRCACVDTHHEQRDAWEAIIEAGMPAEAIEVFADVSAIDYDQAIGPISDTLRARNKLQEVELARELAAHFRAQYEKSKELAHQSPLITSH